MRVRLHIIFCILGCIILRYKGLCQKTGSRSAEVSLPAVTLMDIEPAGDIPLAFNSPAEAGKALVNPTPNTTKWLNYTSAIPAGGSFKIVTASINITIPGIDIKLQAGTASGTGGGILGSSTGLVTLSTSAKTIITGIGGAYTGNGPNNGYRLTISAIADASNYSLIEAQANTQVVVTYTLSSN